MTLRAGVVGHPVAHSLSPLIHGAWIAAAGLDATYEKLDVAPTDFAVFVRSGHGLRGLNVTVPHKEAALACADEVRPAARRAGAANLLTFESGGITADNTDGIGLLAALREQAGFDPTGKIATVLGAGGAARGAVAALLDAGASQVWVVNRTLERARALMVLGAVKAAGWSKSTDAFLEAAVIINATTLGLGGGPGPHAPLGMTAPDCVVMDMVYKPLRTQLLIEAERLGRPTVDGLAMLIGQARPSFEAFYGRTPDAGVDVRGLALKALGE